MNPSGLPQPRSEGATAGSGALPHRDANDFDLVKVSGAAKRRAGEQRHPTFDPCFNEAVKRHSHHAVHHHLAIAWFRGFDMPHEADWIRSVAKVDAA